MSLLHHTHRCTLLAVACVFVIWYIHTVRHHFTHTCTYTYYTFMYSTGGLLLYQYMYRERINCSKESVLVGSDVMRGLNVFLYRNTKINATFNYLHSLLIYDK